MTEVQIVSVLAPNALNLAVTIAAFLWMRARLKVIGNRFELLDARVKRLEAR